MNRSNFVRRMSQHDKSSNISSFTCFFECVIYKKTEMEKSFLWPLLWGTCSPWPPLVAASDHVFPCAFIGSNLMNLGIL